MDLSTLVSAISSVGFPIVFCIVMFNYIKQQNEQHTHQVDNLTKVVQDNTVVVAHLVDKLDELEGRLK